MKAFLMGLWEIYDIDPTGYKGPWFYPIPSDILKLQTDKDACVEMPDELYLRWVRLQAEFSDIQRRLAALEGER